LSVRYLIKSNNNKDVLSTLITVNLGVEFSSSCEPPFATKLSRVPQGHYARNLTKTRLIHTKFNLI